MNGRQVAYNKRDKLSCTNIITYSCFFTGDAIIQQQLYPASITVFVSFINYFYCAPSVAFISPLLLLRLNNEASILPKR